MAKIFLRLVTLNSWKGDGKYSKRLKLISKGLQELQPDIVCLQESLQTEDSSMDTAAYLGRELNLKVTFGPGRLKTRSIEGAHHCCYSGLAILSRIKPIESTLTKLPACAADLDRSYLSALFYWQGQFLTITNVHLTHLANEEVLRKKQLQSALVGTNTFYGKIKPLKEHKGNTHPVSFCCGDYNWEVSDGDILNLQRETGLFLTDCYVKGGGQLPGYTFAVDNGTPCRIDYIFNLSGGKSPALTCHNAKVILAGKDEDGLRPSDHLGVMVDIEMV
jgi:endonuclease/exonuclease/phosphatase family metal-dependent hydrolase